MKFKINQKVVALAAAGLVLLSGATVTSLAAWTDTEWVNGGVETLPGLGTSTFDVQQNVTTDSTSWASQETSPGGVVDFGSTASALTPGTSVYGFVRLRTVTNSLGGTLTLLHETSVTGSPFLTALRYGA
jgi:predicted ribosomally synthesized peptide with SipW-like signal peptide